MNNIAIAVLMGMTFTVSAQDGIIGRYESISGESYNQFATRVGKFLNDWTAKNNAEGCGNITKNEGKFYVILQTQNSQLSCESSYMVTGTEQTGDTIHSHPNYGKNSVVVLTEETKAAAKNAGINLDEVKSIKVKTKNYSNADYAQGSGLLVTDGVLMYQSGKGTEEVISKL